MKQTYEVTLPSGTVVVFVEPTVDDMLSAQKSGQGDDKAILAHVIREIDGAKVSYEELRGSGLGTKLRLKDVIALAMVVSDLTLPSVEELQSAKGSMRTVAR